MLTNLLSGKGPANAPARSGHGVASVIPRLNEILERPLASDGDEAPDAATPGSVNTEDRENAADPGGP